MPKQYFFLATVLSLLVGGGFPFAAAEPAAKPPRPNIIFILADDMGYGEADCYGQKLIQTPNIDRMAREGMLFRQFYAGATVCAPSRSVLMTGLHQGHTRVRGNGGKGAIAQALRPEDVTVADILHQSGYQTALIGKWGLGDVGGAEVGLPRRHGFDYFFGYLSQVHAHNHYPDFLWRNETKVPIPNGLHRVGNEGAGYATNAVAYADDLLADEAMQFVERSQKGPFFLYLAFSVPHANNERTKELKNGAEVPDLGPYANKDWTPQNKGHAAMITRLDGYVGKILEELKRLGIDEKTLVIFSSDNGPHKESGNDPDFFHASGPFRGIKRDLTDGGIRVPFIARWPGTIRRGRLSMHPGYFGDFMATAAELAGAPIPTNLDSISLVPALRGRKCPEHDHFYWEFHEKGFFQAVLYRGRWKAIRNERITAPLELYDLKNDPGEQKNLADEKPKLTAELDAWLNTARSDSPDWPIKEPPAKTPKS